MVAAKLLRLILSQRQIDNLVLFLTDSGSTSDEVRKYIRFRASATITDRDRRNNIHRLGVAAQAAKMLLQVQNARRVINRKCIGDEAVAARGMVFLRDAGLLYISDSGKFVIRKEAEQKIDSVVSDLTVGISIGMLPGCCERNVEWTW